MKYFILVLSLTLFASCSGSKMNSDTTNTAPTVENESDFCATSRSYSPGTAVSGTAKFRRRGLNLTIQSGVVTSATTGGVIATALPIKYAEIRVTSLSSGQVIQCGTTNSVGELKGLDGSSPLFLPNDAGSFTIEVYARSNYTFPSIGKPSSATLSTAVKEDIYSNSVYKISGTYISAGFGGSNSPLNLVAEANESTAPKIEGAAFNIYNDWVTTFEYLINTSNTSNLDVSCLNQKLDMFWKAGFNPVVYLDSSADPNSGLSFYLRDDHELYICGGAYNNVSTKDTDHFDDAVILHEIGHHVENVCGRMDSPGGQHFAQYRIDPRLAWSEAWGNFFGAHILKNNTSKINPNLPVALPNGEWLHYSDTKGYFDGTTPTFNGSLILMRLNKAGNGTGLGSTYDAVNPTTNPGESHVREASIARGLFKVTNNCGANCGGGITFDKYWKALGTTVNGMGVSTSPFSSSAKFFAKVYAANGNTFSASTTTIMTNDESLHMVGSASYVVTATSSSTGSISTNAWPGYGIKLTTNSSCNANLLQPRSTLYTYSTESDQRFSNHFYTIKKSDLSGVTSIRLVPDSSCSVDMDLVLFNSDYEYNEDCTSYNSTPACNAVAKTTSSDVVTYSRGSTSTEQISISGLGTGYYLLNVRGYSATPTSIPSNSSCVYRLTDQNGSILCPSTSY